MPTSIPRTCAAPLSVRPRGQAKLAAEREQAIAELKAAHDEAQQKTAALLAEATKYHSESADRLEADLAEAARIRAEALPKPNRARPRPFRRLRLG